MNNKKSSQESKIGNTIQNSFSKGLEITPDSLKLQYLKKAVDKSVNLISFGLEYLNKNSFTEDESVFSLSFLSLSRGFELLMKCMICYKRYNDTKDDKRFRHFPRTKDMRKEYSHNLDKLRKEIVKNYQRLFRGKTPNSKMILQLKKDRDFSIKDENLIKTLKIISKYGTEGRYYYELNYVTSKNKKKKKDLLAPLALCKNDFPKNKSPKLEMDELITEFLEKDEQLRNTFTNSINDEEYLSISNKVWQEIIQRYIRPYLNEFREILSRQFAYGILGDEAKKCRSIFIFAFPT